MMPEISGISDCGKILCQDENEKLVDELDVLFEISSACHRLTLKNLFSISALLPRLCFFKFLLNDYFPVDNICMINGVRV